MAEAEGGQEVENGTWWGSFRSHRVLSSRRKTLVLSWVGVGQKMSLECFTDII